MDSGEVDPLVRRECPALFHAGEDVRVPDAVHPQADPAVVQEEQIVGAHVLRKGSPGDGYFLLVARNVAGGEGEGLPFLQHRLLLAERSGPDFHTLQILQDGDRTAHPLGHLADDPDAAGVIVVRAVGKIQPRHVHPRLNHREDRLLAVRGGADRGDDPGADVRRKAFGHGCLSSVIRDDTVRAPGARAPRGNRDARCRSAPGPAGGCCARRDAPRRIR